MTPADRAAGYDHRLAISQLEVSLTDVFDRPVQGRHVFEALIRENLDLGRPDRVGLLFPFRIRRTTPPPTLGYRTRVITDGVEPSLPIEYKHSHVKQYFKEQHALRTETTINNPNDFYVNKGIAKLDSATRASWRSCRRSSDSPICPEDVETATSGLTSKRSWGGPTPTRK